MFRMVSPAQHGSASAQNNLGVLQGGNYGIKKNVRAALQWLAQR